MSFYTGRIKELFLNPLNVGDIAEPSATGETGSIVCGAGLRVTIKFDSTAHTIKDAKFKATGCGYLIAAASMLAETLKDLTIEEASRLPTLLESVFAEQLGVFPTEKRHCALLCRDALGAAMTGYRTSSLVEWSGDDALICTCFGVSEKAIEKVIESVAFCTVEQITVACSAGGGCGSCQPLIEDILEDYLRTSNHE